MSIPKIAVSRKRIAAFCQRNHIRRLSLFGSVLRADFKPDSDVVGWLNLNLDMCRVFPVI